MVAEAKLRKAGAAASRSSKRQYMFGGVNPTMCALERAVRQIAPTDIPVLLVGESGTGKEVIALELHRLSKRSGNAFVKCSCARVSPDSLTFQANAAGNGTENGIDTAGSLFLDEISQLDSSSQERLLTLIPSGTGVPTEHSLRLRLVSSTTRNLEEEMRCGRFREELYYQTNGVCLRLPPLRQRKDDIPFLLEFFLKKYCSEFARPKPVLESATMDLLLRYSWPGNIRQLENVARKIVVLGDEQVAIADLAAHETPRVAACITGSVHERPGVNDRSLKEVARQASRRAEREMILKQLELTHWNRKRTARELQVSYKALLYKLKQMNLDGSGSSDPS